ncbi:MAG: phosphoglucomutase/phosphomannomutase family protein [Clostridiales bacterium]|nr:phosphoglucomutase/phosphomannomutase family protein [Clostridiales bacterium]
MIKFGTGGFRDIMNDNFNKLNVQKIAQAICLNIKKENSKKPVVIGYDKRFMSDHASKWVAEVFAGNGVKCKLYTKPVPTPAVMYTVMNEGLDYGVTITASHNPYYYNGLKITKTGGRDASVEFTTSIEKIVNKNLKIKTMPYQKAKDLGLIEDFDNIKSYMRAISKFVSKDIKNNKLKVLFNAMHGVTGECLHILAKNYNIKKYTVLNEDIDPYFEHKLPSPSESTLEEFKKQVVRGRYSVGLACDGDGDRLGVVDELGNFHTCNTLLGVIYYYLVKYREFKGDVVKTYATSILVEKLAKTFGFECHNVPVGFKFVSAKMAETDALLGGEGSGGLTMRNFTPSKDSLFAISLILDAMALINKPLSEIVQEVKNSCEYTSTYIENQINFLNRNRIIKALNKKTPAFSYKCKKTTSKDGCRYEFEDGSWVMIRFSGTENLIRYYIEFATEIECERNIKAIEKFIEKYDK